MSIIKLQRRLREIGRIRIGETVDATNRKGEPIKRPKKLDTFRLTSPDGSVISSAAEIFGGDPKPWTDAPTGGQFEVITKAASLNVIVPPNGMAFSQYYEEWSGGGCQKRCDGEWDVVRDKACDCDPDKRSCKFHTRLSVILTELPGLGVWRLDTQGYYAAVELAGVVDVISFYADRGQHLPGRLRLEQREVKRPGEPTNKFVVPVLDIDVNLADLLLGRAASGPELGAGEQRSFTAVNQGALPPAPELAVASQVAAVSEAPAPKPARKNAAVPMTPTGLQPRTAAQAAAEEAAQPAEPIDEGFDVDPIRKMMDEFGPRLRKTIGATWRQNQWGTIAKNGTARPITKAESEAAWLYVSDEHEAMKKRSLRIVMACKDAGLDDNGRHGLIAYATSGQTSSSKDVTEAEVHAVLEAAEAVKSGALVWKLEDGSGESYFVPSTGDAA